MAVEAAVFPDVPIKRTALGYTATQHGAKLPAWILRLRIARRGLDDAVRAGRGADVAAQLADVWFWIGRLTGEGLAASGDPRYADAVSAGIRELHRSYGSALRARALLLRAGQG